MKTVKTVIGQCPKFSPSKGNRASPVLAILTHPNADHARKAVLLSEIINLFLQRTKCGGLGRLGL